MGNRRLRRCQVVPAWICEQRFHGRTQETQVGDALGVAVAPTATAVHCDDVLCNHMKHQTGSCAWVIPHDNSMIPHDDGQGAWQESAALRRPCRQKVMP